MNQTTTQTQTACPPLPLTAEQVQRIRQQQIKSQQEVDRITRRDRRWTDNHNIFNGTPSGSQP
ncbi:MAG: hypothetical protein V4772_03270 [Pseudomonadota bacterium]